MKIEGGCYCGALRYEAAGEALLKMQCHCRECQYITGGGGNLTMGVAKDGFTYTKGSPVAYRRDDLEQPVTREFCGACGTPINSRSPNVPDMVLLKIGSLDKPEVFGQPQAAIYVSDKYDHHVIADGVTQFDKLPAM